MSSIRFHTFKDFWQKTAPYLAPPLSAGGAIVPAYWFFMAKTAQQAGEPIPCKGFTQTLIAGCQAAPTLGAIVGIQLIFQGAVEKAFGNQSDNFGKKLFSSLIVGGVSVVPLAIFNGQTMGLPVRESFRRITLKQAGAILAQETCFLFSVSLSDPISAMVKRKFKENKFAENGAFFATGAIGAACNHPANTALTLWQKGLPVRNIRQLYLGSPLRTIGLGLFNVCYQNGKKILIPKKPGEES